MLDTLLGNEPVKAALNDALEKGALSHALLITSPPGCGAGYAARCIAADLLYPDAPAEDAAVRAVMSLESPELMRVEGEGASGQIPVDRIREVRRDAHLSSLSAEGRVVWIRGAQKMAPPAYNALLKILEEPPGRVQFILTAESAAGLPPTLQSRCAKYALAPVEAGVAAGVFERELDPGSPATLPGLLAWVYGGSIGLGLDVLQNPAREAVLRDALLAAEAAATEDTYSLLRVFSRYEGREEAPGEGGLSGREKRAALLFDLSRVLAAFLREDPPPASSAGGQTSVLLSSRRAAALLPLVQDAALSMQKNAAPKSLFSALALQIEEGFHTT